MAPGAVGSHQTHAVRARSGDDVSLELAPLVTQLMKSSAQNDGDGNPGAGTLLDRTGHLLHRD